MIKKILIIKLFLITIVACGQSEHNFFFPLDTITMKKPVIFSLNRYEGSFITEVSKFNKTCLTKKKVLNSNEIFFLSFNPYFLSKKNDFYYSDKECEITVNENLPYDTFKGENIRFVVGLIKASYYQKMISTVDKEKTVLYDTRGNVYYKIVFPICD